MDVSRFHILRAAITEMASCLDDIAPGVYAGFNCGELDSIAQVLAVAGHEGTAALVIARHAEHDEFDPDGGDDGQRDAHADIAREIHHRNGESWRADVLAKSESYVKRMFGHLAS